MDLRRGERFPLRRREVAKALHTVLRPYDLCARYAGDEFVLVLAQCTREAAELRRRQLQDRIGEIELEVGPGVRKRLAASAGVSVFPHDGASYEALIADADRRMYRDKANRRKRQSTAAATAGDFPVAPISDAAPTRTGRSGTTFETHTLVS